MDNSSIILGVVITILILLPTIYLASAGKRKLKKNLLKFIDSLSSKGINISDYEQIGQYIIGIDKDNGVLVYRKGENDPEIFDLKNVFGCSNNIPRNSRKNISNNLFLELDTRDQRTPKSLLEFYDSTFALDPSSEIKLIENWTIIVNDFLNKK